MVSHELNFKHMSTEKYRMVRLLKTPAPFVAVYQARIKRMRGIEGVIIFPEQILCLEDQKIVNVVITNQPNHNGVDMVAASVIRSTSPRLWSSNCGGLIQTIDEVFAHEAANIGNVATAFYVRESKLRASQFLDERSYERYWFTNERSAINFAKKQIKL